MSESILERAIDQLEACGKNDRISIEREELMLLLHRMLAFDRRMRGFIDSLQPFRFSRLLEDIDALLEQQAEHLLDLAERMEVDSGAVDVDHAREQEDTAARKRRREMVDLQSHQEDMPPFLSCYDLDGEDHMLWVLHTRYPRFIAKLDPENPLLLFDIGDHWPLGVTIWIDEPAEDEMDLARSRLGEAKMLLDDELGIYEPDIIDDNGDDDDDDDVFIVSGDDDPESSLH